MEYVVTDLEPIYVSEQAIICTKLQNTQVATRIFERPSHGTSRHSRQLMDTVTDFQQSTVKQQYFAYQTHSGHDVTACCQVSVSVDNRFRTFRKNI
jgi:hypothetical protein